MKSCNSLLNCEASKEIVLRLDQPISKPKDQVVTSLDDLYLQYFSEKRCRCTHSLVSAAGEIVGLAVIPKRRSCLLVSAQALRYAVMGFGSHMKSGNQSGEHTILYLGRCYEHIHRAIFHSPTVELIYVCYTLFRLALFMDESIETIFIHLSGFHAVRQYLKSNPCSVEEWEWNWMEALWLDALVNLSYKLDNRNISVFSQTIKEVCGMLDELNNENDQAVLNLETPHSRRFQLQIYIQYYFTYYVLLVSGVLEDETNQATRETTDTLASLTKRFVEFLPQYNDQLPGCLQKLAQTELGDNLQSSIPTSPLSNFDFTSLFLYSFAMYINNILALQGSRRDNSAAYISALYLYHNVIVSKRENPHITPRRKDIVLLLFVGFVLMRLRYPGGNCRRYSDADVRRKRVD